MQDIFQKASPICSVLSNPGPYIDKQVVISGLYLAEPHQQVLFDRNCNRLAIGLRGPARGSADQQADSTLRLALQRNSTARVPVVYSGILKSHPLIVGCSMAYCFTYTLEGAQLMAARLP